MLVFKKRVLIPEDKVRETIDMEYKKSFAGMNRLFQQMLRKYIGVSEDEVIKYVKNQEVQQLHDQTTTPSLQQTKERPIPKEPFSMVQIDLAKFCYRYLFVAIDVLSKHLWVKVLPVATKTDEAKNMVRGKATKDGLTVSKALAEYLLLYPNIKTIQTDNGSDFKDKHFQELLLSKDKNEKKDINMVFGSPYNPNSQGIVERVNGTIKNALEKYLTNSMKKCRAKNDNTGWQTFLYSWVEEYNNIKHSATGFTPNEMIQQDTGKVKRVIKARKNISEQSEDMVEERKELYKNNKKSLTFKVGDKVRLRLAKTSVLEKGSKQKYTKEIYTIEDIFHPKDGVPVYRLEERVNETFSPDRLMKIKEDRLITIPEPKPIVRKPPQEPRAPPPPRVSSERARRRPSHFDDYDVPVQRVRRRAAPSQEEEPQAVQPQAVPPEIGRRSGRQRQPPRALDDFVR